MGRISLLLAMPNKYYCGKQNDFIFFPNKGYVNKEDTRTENINGLAS